jgi:hypothetical protein
MAKYTLPSSAGELDFDLIGITTPLNHYEAVTEINNALRIDLSLDGFVPMNLRDGKLFSFSLYTCADDNMGLEYSLIPNSSNLELHGNDKSAGVGLFSGLNVEESARLIREMPKTDYFLIIKGESNSTVLHRILHCLGEISGFYSVDIISVTDLPSRKNLIF